jgi:hypothetical protein
MQATIERDSSWAPGSYLIVPVGMGTRDEGTELVQDDWGFPSLASNLGFVPCECGATDGTVDCAHFTATEMIGAAREFINKHLGEPFDASEYFEDED